MATKKFDDLFDRTAAKKQAKEIKERQAKRGGFNFWKPLKGTSVFRILPPGSEMMMSRGLMGKLVYKHFLFWDNTSHGIFTSGVLTDPEVYDYCPIQDALDRIEDAVPAEQFKRVKAKPRAFFNVLLRKALDPNDNPINEELWGKILLAETASGLYEFVHTAFNNDQIGFFVHPHEGADIIVVRVGEGIDTKYTYQVQPGKWTPVIGTIEETDKLCDKLPDLDRFTLLKEEVRKKQIAAAGEILKWGSRFGEVDESLGSTDANLERLMGFSKGNGNEPGDDAAPSGEDTTTAEKPAEPDKREEKPVEEKPAEAPPPAAAAGQPEMGKNGLPVCYEKFKDRNPEVTDNQPTDAQCRTCNFKLPCAIDS